MGAHVSVLEGLTRRWFLKSAPVAVAAAPLAVKQAANSGGVQLASTAHPVGRSLPRLLAENELNPWQLVHADERVKQQGRLFERYANRREAERQLRYHNNDLDPSISCLRSASLGAKHRMQLRLLEQRDAEWELWEQAKKSLFARVAAALGLPPDTTKDWN